MGLLFSSRMFGSLQEWSQNSRDLPSSETLILRRVLRQRIARKMGCFGRVSLGWKLAQVVKRISPESLLDTYHAERHPVAARVLRNTMAQVALLRTDDR